MTENNTRDQLDLLRHIEVLTEEINSRMAEKSRSVLRRYPLTFAIITLFGVVAVGEGIKGLLEEVEYFNLHPLTLALLGLVILIFVGSLYKKLK